MRREIFVHLILWYSSRFHRLDEDREIVRNLLHRWNWPKLKKDVRLQWWVNERVYREVRRLLSLVIVASVVRIQSTWEQRSERKTIEIFRVGVCWSSDLFRWVLRVELSNIFQSNVEFSEFIRTRKGLNLFSTRSRRRRTTIIERSLSLSLTRLCHHSCLSGVTTFLRISTKTTKKSEMRKVFFDSRRVTVWPCVPNWFVLDAKKREMLRRSEGEDKPWLSCVASLWSSYPSAVLVLHENDVVVQELIRTTCSKISQEEVEETSVSAVVGYYNRNATLDRIGRCMSIDVVGQMIKLSLDLARVSRKVCLLVGLTTMKASWQSISSPFEPIKSAWTRKKTGKWFFVWRALSFVLSRKWYSHWCTQFDVNYVSRSTLVLLLLLSFRLDFYSSFASIVVELIMSTAETESKGKKVTQRIWSCLSIIETFS